MRALLPLAVLLTSPALAEPWDCHFTVECIASEACDAAAFEVTIIAADHEGQLFLSTVTGNSPLTRLTDQGDLPATYASAGRDGLAELLTVEADFSALLTLHIFDGSAQAATYFGTCEVLE
ncbi:MAG: hypothetical protein AAF376_07930 [Pseudomonadota bacterium]